MGDSTERCASDISRAHFDRQQLQSSSNLEYNEQLRAQVRRLEEQLRAQGEEYSAHRQKLQEDARLAITSASTSHVVEVAQSQQLERTGEALRIVQRERDAAEGALVHCQQRAQTLLERAQSEGDQKARVAERSLEQARGEADQLRQELGRRMAEWERSRVKADEEILEAQERAEALEEELGRTVAACDKKESGLKSQVSQLTAALDEEATRCGALELQCADLVLMRGLRVTHSHGAPRRPLSTR